MFPFGIQRLPSWVSDFLEEEVGSSR